MSIVKTDTSNYSAIADAIRAKGVEGSWKPSQMASAITSLAIGGGDYTFIPPETYLAQEGYKILVPQYHGYMSSAIASDAMTFTFNEPTTQVYYFNVWGYSSGYQFIVSAKRNGGSFYNNTFNSGTPDGVSWTGYAYKVEIPIGTEEIVVTVNHSGNVFSSTSFVRCAILDTDSILLPQVDSNYTHILTSLDVDTKHSSVCGEYISKNVPDTYRTNQGYLQTKMDGENITIYTIEGEAY